MGMATFSAPITTGLSTFLSRVPYPAIIPIPDALGSKGTGMKTLKANVEKAVGVDILNNS